MSELITPRATRADFHWQLLATVSVLALCATASVTGVARAQEADRPTVWIEFGGQLERVDTEQAIFSPAFLGVAPASVANTMTDAQRPSRYSIGGEGKITIAPQGSDWVFLAAVRYGQVKNPRHLHYETPGLPSFFNYKNGVKQASPVKPSWKMFGDGQTHSAESHFVLDFQAGKDVGLGMFGSGGSSVFNFGVRYTQFTSRSDVTLHARPIVGYGDPVRYSQLGKYYTMHKPFRQTNTAVLHATRNTHAIGPSVSWDGSLPVVGHSQATTVDFDWGVNAAALFGRQRTHEEHSTTGHSVHYDVNVKANVTTQYAQATSHDRSRSVFIPNVGAFAGLSLKFPNAKVSLGYRGDFFFNATDSGIDARNAANQNFYGPFATISVGLGG